MGDLGKDFKTDWGLDGREFGGLRMGFGRVGVREKKRGYLVVVWEDNEGMRNNTGILSPLVHMGISNHSDLSGGKRTKFPFSHLLLHTYKHTQTNANAPDCPVPTLPSHFYYWNTVSDYCSVDRVWESKNVFTSGGDLDTFQSTLIVEQLPIWEKNDRLYGLFFPPSQPIPAPTLTRGMRI